MDTLFKATVRSHSSAARRPKFTSCQRDVLPPKGCTRGSSWMVGSPELRDRCVSFRGRQAFIYFER